MFLNAADAADERSRKEMERFQVERMAGQGTFGTVQLGREKATGVAVAIKKVIQDPRFRNRELQIMQDLAVLHHPNIVQLQSYFYTIGERNHKDIYLNVVMEYVPDTLHRCCRNYYRRQAAPPPILIKVFLFQLIRSIGCLHLPSVNVCHRDIKPHNVLVNEADGTLKLCDFGSAKKLSLSEPNVAYICSRYYRAPELIFGNQHYTTAVDVWSVGCIFAEMMLGEPIFRGDNSAGQLHEIVRVLGRPSREVLRKLNPSHTDVDLFNSKGTPWGSIFREQSQMKDAKEAYDLLSALLQYLPEERVKPYEALCHPYFDELHDAATKLPNDKDLPADLFRFLPVEVDALTDAQKSKLLGK
ncbi:glycogen synthase kinase 3 (GSK3) [Leptomonas pyrrhocoris]|uniref:Glycogen synthase kinase 3 (GSK3) n=1 Tax=Leptomonas pyrrhocoris TaxID=157538 RepID=A0A0M9FYH6_LEPPY|nr:glycogen synthase kinase 3 (GSK3) [Leptomonas pyrrhocoris]XP_015656915.1 glycogen synthase kinase 3 (GSK3) [Leptomonas pyrrhocoris]KPA78475.1 glycogen synthase kinase 3 (GSK3) [Leptomonas pyrrhocoris]KPA78476.1 glycogen synthase kinase 3 (GSK3) [Leptomonas pyrrhocoris]|eukprot:XP_015656914.1 glycogen synthase kinase 3 (GSK3) [Leptomonas pyrrhocoris]